MIESSDPSSHAPSKARTVAAIDVGSNSIRLVVAQVLDDGQIEVLERLQRAVRLGQESFRRGRLGGQSMRAAVAALSDYTRVLQTYRVQRVRAVATSAVREATNADTFLDRIFLATGLNVEVIATSEESRLTVSAVLQTFGSALGLNRAKTLIAEVSAGSTLLTMLQDGEIAFSESLRLGSIRVQELLGTSDESPQRSAELLRHHVANVIATVGGSLELEGIDSFVAVGGDARFAAKEIGHPAGAEGLFTVDSAAFDKLVRRLQKSTAEELAKRYGLPFAEAETLNPALLVYQILLHAVGAGRMIVSQASMRDGLLLELAREATGQEDPAVYRGVIHSAMAIGEKYRADMDHAQNVAEAASRLFDYLQPDHGLAPRHRLLLRVAALLHEIGSFVSSRAHHKHGYYLILNSEIFGLNRDETTIVAHIARYHRRSGPKTSHVEYMSLPREKRVVVNKLAAILRVADALAGNHLQRLPDMRFERQGDDLIVYVSAGVNVLLVERSVALTGDMFEDIYGMKVRVEES